VYRRTVNLRCAAFPSKVAPTILPPLAEVFPNILPAKHVLETGLSNINAIMHPAGMVGNAGWIERHGGDLLYYRDAISPAVSHMIEAVDRERLEIVKRLNLAPRSFVEIFHSAGLTSDAALEANSVFRATQDSEPNQTIKAPRTHDHRYMHEDVGYGLVPMAALARLFHIDTPVIDSLITLASTINGIDYRREGLTLEKMGLENASAADLPKRLFEGF
jgi:opine dehydrogenase